MAGVLLNHTHSTSPWYDVRVRLWDTINFFQQLRGIGRQQDGVALVLKVRHQHRKQVLIVVS